MRNDGKLAAILLLLGSCSCSSHVDPTEASEATGGTEGMADARHPSLLVSETDDDDADTEQRGGFDEDRARDAAKDDVATYADTGMPYGCTDDCSGHEAGVRWAKKNDVDDGSCGGDSQSFSEGCQAFGEAVSEKVDEARSAYESGATDYEQ